MVVVLIQELFQDSQLNQAAKTSGSSPAVSPEELTEPADSTCSQQEQTSDQPAVAQSEATSSGLPIDLSTKKSTESDSNTGVIAAASAPTTASQGKHLNILWCLGCVVVHRN